MRIACIFICRKMTHDKCTNSNLRKYHLYILHISSNDSSIEPMPLKLTGCNRNDSCLQLGLLSSLWACIQLIRNLQQIQLILKVTHGIPQQVAGPNIQFIFIDSNHPSSHKQQYTFETPVATHESLKSLVRSYGTQKNIIEPPKNLIESNGTRLNSLEPCGRSWNSMEQYGVLWKVLERLCNIM